MLTVRRTFSTRDAMPVTERKRLVLLLSTQVHARLRYAAEATDRNVTNYVTALLNETARKEWGRLSVQCPKCREGKMHAKGADLMRSRPEERDGGAQCDTCGWFRSVAATEALEKDLTERGLIGDA